MSPDPCRCAVCAVLRARATPTRRTTPLPMDEATYAWRVAFGQRLMAAGAGSPHTQERHRIFWAGWRMVLATLAADQAEMDISGFEARCRRAEAAHAMANAEY